MSLKLFLVVTLALAATCSAASSTTTLESIRYREGGDINGAWTLGELLAIAKKEKPLAEEHIQSVQAIYRRYVKEQQLTGVNFIKNSENGRKKCGNMLEKASSYVKQRESFYEDAANKDIVVVVNADEGVKKALMGYSSNVQMFKIDGNKSRLRSAMIKARTAFITAVELVENQLHQDLTINDQLPKFKDDFTKCMMSE